MSVFIDDLKEKAKSKYKKEKENNEIIISYNNLVNYNNIFITLFCVIVGSIAFSFMGYSLISILKNSNFYVTNFFDLMMLCICVNVVLWGIKSLVTYAVWKGVSKKEIESNSCFAFFTIEGMSDISFLIFIPIFLLFSYILGAYFGGLVLGGAIFFKYILMYASYPSLIPLASKTDRLILVLSSLGTLILVKVFISLFFI